MMNNPKNKRIIACVLLIAAFCIAIWGITSKKHTSDRFSDGIELTDPNTIFLDGGHVEVNFSEVLLSSHNETRKLIVIQQSGTVSTDLTDRIIQQLDFSFMKKTQKVSYTGTGYFVVDLDNLNSSNVIQDKAKKTLTINIGHSYLQAVEINPNDIIVDDVKQSLLARGDIKLSMADYNEIEKDLRNRLEEKFNTVENGQEADDIALKMVKETFEPIVKAIDSRYTVIVAFQ